jgi:NADPH:quinone reductase-like Zn-dependent oxidoreductase
MSTMFAALGADRVLDYNADDFAKVFSDCDVAFDTVGGDVQALRTVF